MVSNIEHTSKLGTETLEGFIGHLKTGTGVRLPVKLDFTGEKVNDLYSPIRKGGKLAFALPGGGEIFEP